MVELNLWVVVEVVDYGVAFGVQELWWVEFGSAVDDGYFPLAEMKQPVMVAAYEHEVV